MLSLIQAQPKGYDATIPTKLAFWYRNATTRRSLRTLPPRQLADIGITADAAAREAQKWFWQS